ncbi:MAG: MFS transporter [Woeseia sp.]|nr:MFS transporter [Woeseia sp.]
MPKIILMISLIFVGELIFSLVFNIPLFFRPTFLQTFNLTNTQLGDMFAIYGIIAMLSYFPGGVIADRYSARFLITVSLFLTALGGVYLSTIPNMIGMRFLYGYWGVTSVFFFWGALIKATREWGGNESQGLAFGLLDGGRGIVAAGVATVGVFILSIYMPNDPNQASPLMRESAFKILALYYSTIVFSVAILAWFVIPDSKIKGNSFSPLKNMSNVLVRPIIWLQAVIIICAYCGYKGIGNYSLYAVEVLGFNEVEGARIASYAAWTRPIAALIAGLIADRYSASRSILIMFLSLFIMYGSWSYATLNNLGIIVIYANFFITCIFVYALRGVYFALLEENKTPKNLTGAAVGLVSVIGYTPDIFFAPIAGRILDANPGIIGHQNYFFLLSIISLIGVFITIGILSFHKKKLIKW